MSDPVVAPAVIAPVQQPAAAPVAVVDAPVQQPAVAPAVVVEPVVPVAAPAPVAAELAGVVGAIGATGAAVPAPVATATPAPPVPVVKTAEELAAEAKQKAKEEKVAAFKANKLLEDKLTAICESTVKVLKHTPLSGGRFDITKYTSKLEAKTNSGDYATDKSLTKFVGKLCGMMKDASFTDVKFERVGTTSLLHCQYAHPVVKLNKNKMANVVSALNKSLDSFSA